MSSTNDDSAAARSLPERLAAAQENVGRLGHDGRNDQQRFSFTSIHAIADASRRALAAEGLALLPTGVDVLADDEVTTRSGSTGYRVVVHTTWRLACTGPNGAESVDLSSVGEAIDFGDKAHNKATTFARKNLLIGLLNLSTGDADPDEHAPEAAPRQRQQRSAQASRPGSRDRRRQSESARRERFRAVLAVGAVDGESDHAREQREEAIKAAIKAAGFTSAADLDADERFAEARRIAEGAAAGARARSAAKADEAVAAFGATGEVLSEAQMRAVHAAGRQHGLDHDTLREIATDLFDVDSMTKIPRAGMDRMLEAIAAHPIADDEPEQESIPVDGGEAAAGMPGDPDDPFA